MYSSLSSLQTTKMILISIYYPSTFIVWHQLCTKLENLEFTYIVLEPYFWKQSAKIWNRRTQKFIPHSLIISCPVNRALPVFVVNYDALELKWDFGNGLEP